MCRLRDLATFDEEIAAADSHQQDSRPVAGARIPIDRREAPIQASTVRLFDDASYLSRLIGRLQRPRVAVAMGTLKDFGISRVVQARSE